MKTPETPTLALAVTVFASVALPSLTQAQSGPQYTAYWSEACPSPGAPGSGGVQAGLPNGIGPDDICYWAQWHWCSDGSAAQPATLLYPYYCIPYGINAITGEPIVNDCITFNIDNRNLNCQPSETLVVVVSPATANPPVQTSNFTMLPSVQTSGYSPYGAGPQELALEVACERSSGEIVPNCDIKLEWAAEAGSGGHVHNTDRPPGIIATNLNGITGGSNILPGPPGSISDNSQAVGILSFNYIAPEASGTIHLAASGSGYVNGVRLQSDPALVTIHVQDESLQHVTGSGLSVDSSSTMHGNNNGNATAEMAGTLQDMATDFAQGCVPKIV